MMLGLKRDLRVEDENIIYPQEVDFPFPTIIGYEGE